MNLPLDREQALEPLKQPIYLDHQATTPIDDRVLAVMMPFLREEFGNPHSNDHILGWKSSQAVETAAEQVAALVGADRDEIIFTSGATESNNLALFGIGRGPLAKSRKRILVSAVEHKSVLAPVRVLAQRDNLRIEHVPVDKRGEIDLTHLADLLTEDVLLVSVMAVNNEIGTIQPLQDISRLCRKVGAIFHSDCAQAAHAFDMGNIAEYVDMLSLSGHKIYGPKGIGAAYIRRDLLRSIEPLIHGGGQQQAIRSGTVPTALCVAMGAAAKIMPAAAIDGELKAIASRRDSLVAKLLQLGSPMHLNGPSPEWRHAGNANICFHGFDAQNLLGLLQPNLAASTGAACTSGIPEPSHVLRAIGLTAEESECCVRFGIGRYTTDADIDTAVALIGAALEQMRSTALAQIA